MTEIKKQKLNAFVTAAIPVLTFILFFTNPFAKVVASVAYSLCFLLFLIRLFVLKNTGYQRAAKTFYLVLLVYFAAMAVSLLYTPDLADGVQRFQSQTKLLMALILVETVASTADAQKYLIASAAGGVVLAAIAIYQGVVQHIYRPPTMWNSVHGGNLLMFGLIALVSLLLYEKKPLGKTAYGIGTLCTGFAFYLNGTRGAWIAFGFVLLVIPFIMSGMTLKKKIAYYAVLLMLAGAISQAPFIKDKVIEAEMNIQHYEKDDARNSLGYRLEMWKASGKMFLRNPILGVGLGGWNRTLGQMAARKEAPDFILHYNQTHNIYLDILSTRGLLGLITFAILIFYPVLYAWKKREPGTEIYRMLLICATIVFLVSGMSDTLVYIRGVFMSYIILVGLSMAVLVRHPSTEYTENHQ